MSTEINILLIEDSKTDAFVINHRLKTVFPDHNITTVHRIREAYDKLRKVPFSLIISDLNLPDSMGPKTIEGIRLIDKNTPILALTGFKTAITEEEALKLGANEVVSKLKISDNTFIETIERMLPDDSAEDPDVLYVEESMPE